jgi:DNA-binding SARP family transcriptional activator
MVAYLALHRNEPITGERLRTRVLNYAKVDASSRTLANTASAVRRSLGADKIGNRLHPVTSLGLYVTHGVTSDIENFHALISKAREVPTNAAAALAREALQLVHGEPLASALRGFEWFLVEGSFAQLQRDGEWAALLVHHEAMLDEQYELAFWSLRQGLLIDPFSDALSDALSQVPRLRQFGGDRSSRAKNKAIGPSGAVMMGWSFNRLINQISQ